jgi:hypothetical protein
VGSNVTERSNGSGRIAQDMGAAALAGDKFEKPRSSEGTNGWVVNRPRRDGLGASGM